MGDTQTKSIAAGTGPQGLGIYPGYLSRAGQRRLVQEVEAVLAAAPPYRPTMPGSGRPFSIRMSNAGPLGWLSDKTRTRFGRRIPVSFTADRFAGSSMAASKNSVATRPGHISVRRTRLPPSSMRRFWLRRCIAPLLAP